MFSERTSWEFDANNLSLVFERLKSDGRDILNLTQSNPSKCEFLYPQEGILGALSNPSNLEYKAESKGLHAARRVVSQYYKEKGIEVDPERIFLTASTSEGYLLLFRLLANPGEKVLFPRPSYPLFELLTQLNDLELVQYSLEYCDKWCLNESTFLETVHGAKAVVLVNPNNPTGTDLRANEIEFVNECCRKKNAAIICDEVFLDYSFDENVVFSSLAGNQENLTFVLGGLSKALGMPQMKLAWIVVNGPDKQVKEAIQRLEIISDTFLSVNTPSQNALQQWMEYKAEIQGSIIERIRENRNCLSRLLSGNPKFSLLNSSGGWYSILRSSEEFDEEEFCKRLLIENNVYVHPGYYFDFHGGTHLVLSLIVQNDIFLRGVSLLLEN